MSTIKGTIRPIRDFGKGEEFNNKGYKFIFSSNIEDWKYGDSSAGRKKRSQSRK